MTDGFITVQDLAETYRTAGAAITALIDQAREEQE